MSKDIIKIPSLSNTQIHKKLKVAAYCRVSTKSKEQKLSYENQYEYYNDLIRSNEDWEFSGIYADKGVTGTGGKYRKEFQRMLDDCERGKIDLIITKSIARFSRNTEILLTVVRQLKLLGIAVRFEKENINTLTAGDEIMLSILSAVAQMESENTSTNITWSIQKKFKNGTFTQYLPYGYKYDEFKNIKIEVEKAKIVKFIFNNYLSGWGTEYIAKELNKKNVKTQKMDYSRPSAVKYILDNPIYTGRIIHQKTYTKDYLSHKRVTNNGELTQYMIQDDEITIVSEECFDRVQQILNYRNKNYSGGDTYLFTEMITCGTCNAFFRRRISSAGSVGWSCSTRLYNKENCSSENLAIPEIEIRKAFVNMCNKLIFNISLFKRFQDRLEEAILEDKENILLSKIDKEMENLYLQEFRLHKGVRDGHIDHAIYLTEINAIENKRNKLRKSISQIDNVYIDYIEHTKEIIRLLSNKTLMIEMDDEIFLRLVKSIVINSKEQIVFNLINGMHINERLVI